MDFNPRSPHGERPRGLREERRNAIFQPTLPARGATNIIGRTENRCLHFNPRSPHGERQVPPPRVAPISAISTHAPRTGSDLQGKHGKIVNPEFQPTLPARGATRTLPRVVRQQGHFNPRSPHGERPDAFERCVHFEAISTHAPRTGSDRALALALSKMSHFNPRSPHGERPGG